MDKSTTIFIIAFILTAIIGGVFYGLTNLETAAPPEVEITTADPGPAPSDSYGPETFYIYYTSSDGTHLKASKRKLAVHTTITAQARELLATLINRPATPKSSVVPHGTRLLGIYTDGTGTAVADFSHEIRDNHSGGVIPELLTVYAIVNTLTLNIPEIKTVRILIDGQSSTTLAGHVDITRPFPPNMMIIK